MMIAYNLCYSTCVGKFDPKTGGTSGRLGILSYSEDKTAAGLSRAAEAHKAWLERSSKAAHGSDSNGNVASTQGSEKSTLLKPSPVREAHIPRTPGGGGTSYNGGVGEGKVAYEGKDPFGQGDIPSPTVSTRSGDGKERRGGGTEERGGARMEGTGGGWTRDWDPSCIHVAPNMAGFCHPSLRQGILPLMLREILETRVMIKGAMKRAEAAGQRVLARTLNARQFALKMISNVTYG